MLNMKKIEEAINESPLWLKMNQEANALYEESGRTPSEEEYQALRNVLIMKTILDDPNAKQLIQDEVWNELQGGN